MTLFRATSFFICLAAAGCSGCGSSTSQENAAAATPARETALAVNDQAPAFSARDQAGNTRTLQEFRGHPVVLYFYPRDATPGCTQEACAFRDSWERILGMGAFVLGVSTDSVESHASFAAEQRLNFPLLADPDERIIGAYGVSTTLGLAHRMTYIIDGNGRIAHVFPDVDPSVHVDEVIAVLERLRAH
ncbi:MAG: peroxiredoxin [Sandaracinaceae bacterium]|jgi:peroxiredoxin Q/BCP|nr:peroxiredoxin [Sandaracinaceae bacterium]